MLGEGQGGWRIVILRKDRHESCPQAVSCPDEISGKVLALRRQEARRNSGFVNPRERPTDSRAGVGRIGRWASCPLNRRSHDQVSRTQMDNEPKTFVLNGRQFAKFLDHAREDRGIDSSVRPRVVPFQTRIEPGIEENRDDIGLPSMPDLRPKATLGRMQICRVDHAKPRISAAFGMRPTISNASPEMDSSRSSSLMSARA